MKWVVLMTLTASLVGGCGRANEPPPGAAEPPTLALTHWTERSELFMEHPPLVAGETVRFAVHLTTLPDYRALNTGRPVIELIPQGGGSTTTLPGSEPLRQGVFRVEGKLPPAGTYRWALVVNAPNLSDRHDLGTTTIFPDATAAASAAEASDGEDAAAISYLKEPQWSSDFMTEPVREREVRASIRVPAVIEPLTGGDAIVSAPASGRFTATSLRSVGDRVTAGQALGQLEARLADSGTDRATLQAQLSEAQLTLEGAQAELARAERLLAERAVPARRVEDARRAVAGAEARVEAARARLTQRDETLRSGGSGPTGSAYVLRAPIAGRVAEVHAALGAAYEEGAPLFRIVRTDVVELQAHVPASDASRVTSVAGVAFEVPGRDDPIELAADHVHHAGVLDPKTGALPVQIEVRNPGELLIGQRGTALLYSGRREPMIVVPRVAVLTEGARPYVFVQLGGETFIRRFIEIAARDGDMVGVRSGLQPGERVVTRGAYDVQLASNASGLPAEGHVH